MSEVQVKSLKKALDALDYIAKECIDKDGATLSAIAAELNEKLPTLRNILRTMESCGYLTRSGKLYRLGSKHYELLRCNNIKKLISVAEPLLGNAAENIGESFVLTTLINGQRKILKRFQGSNEIGVIIDSVDRNRLYSLETTRIMLAFSDPAERERFLLVNGMPDSTWPEASGGNWVECLDELKKNGFASSGEGLLCAYAVPLLNSSGLLLGAIGVFAPSFRTDKQRGEELLQTLKDIAVRVNKQF